MVHKPKHKVHSFRGLVGDSAQDEINLERQNMNVAYRITKFQVIPETPATTINESTVKIYREEQSSVTATIDFTENELLAAAFYRGTAVPSQPISPTTIIFDNVLFSRNIWVTHEDSESSGIRMNYYIELEEVPVTASTLMQLKLGTARRLALRQ